MSLPRTRLNYKSYSTSWSPCLPSIPKTLSRELLYIWHDESRSKGRADQSIDAKSIEQVRNEYPDGRSVITPDLSPTTFTAHLSYINSCTGLNLAQSDIVSLLGKMGNNAIPASSATVSDKLIVKVPPTRPDILHECDLMEDVAIAYGFNKLKKTFPGTNTVAVPLPINKLTDVVRKECAICGFVEVLPLILVHLIASLFCGYSLILFTVLTGREFCLAEPQGRWKDSCNFGES